jgi:hypothetical protein
VILEVSWDVLWTLSFELSQFHGRGSWLVCEMALSVGIEYVFHTMETNRFVRIWMIFDPILY